mgnify:CR=1 FL=1
MLTHHVRPTGRATHNTQPKRINTMSRKFISLVLAASLSLTAFGATTAQAGDKEVFRFIAGAATVAIIANALNDNNRGRHQPQVVTRNGHHGSNYGGYQPHNNPRPQVIVPNRGQVTPRPLPNRVRNQVLPSQCTLTARTRHGTRAYMGDKCLNKNNIRLSALPGQCRTNLAGPRGGTWGAWDVKCMTNLGYRTARR